MGILNRILGKKRKKNDYIQNTYGRTKEAGGSVQAPSPQRTAPKAESDVQEGGAADEKLASVIDKVIEVMKERAQDGPVHVVFGIPESQNKGHMFFRLLRPDDWQLQIGANRAGTNMMVSHFLCHGEKERVLDYLSKPDLKEELVCSIKTLSKSVDDKI